MAGFGPTFPQCPQCNMYHPPLKLDEMCPLAKVKISTGDGKSPDLDLNKFLADFKNILIANIEKKQIKNTKKLIVDIIVEITKFLENYRE